MTHRLNKSAKGEWYVLVGPYDPALVEDLKREVPARSREWLPVARAWRIAPEYADVVQGLIDGRASHG